MNSIKKNGNNSLPDVISYLTMRRAVGILGISFPVVLVIGSTIAGNCDELQSSISNYYHTNMRNIFVGVLCSVAFFLYAYKGYSLADNILGNLAGLFALGIALFPCEGQMYLTDCILTNNPNCITYNLHFISASLFFVTLSSISLFVFTKGDKKNNKRKRKRNIIYKICGYAMLASLVLIALYFSFLEKKWPRLENFSPVFWLESIALWAFGISWLTKGGFVLRDLEIEESEKQ